MKFLDFQNIDYLSELLYNEDVSDVEEPWPDGYMRLPGYRTAGTEDSRWTGLVYGAIETSQWPRETANFVGVVSSFHGGFWRLTSLY